MLFATTSGNFIETPSVPCWEGSSTIESTFIVDPEPEVFIMELIMSTLLSFCWSFNEKEKAPPTFVASPCLARAAATFAVRSTVWAFMLMSLPALIVELLIITLFVVFELLKSAPAPTWNEAFLSRPSSMLWFQIFLVLLILLLNRFLISPKEKFVHCLISPPRTRVLFKNLCHHPSGFS